MDSTKVDGESFSSSLSAPFIKVMRKCQLNNSEEYFTLPQNKISNSVNVNSNNRCHNLNEVVLYDNSIPQPILFTKKVNTSKINFLTVKTRDSVEFKLNLLNKIKETSQSNFTVSPWGISLRIHPASRFPREIHPTFKRKLPIDMYTETILLELKNHPQSQTSPNERNSITVIQCPYFKSSFKTTQPLKKYLNFLICFITSLK